MQGTADRDDAGRTQRLWRSLPLVLLGALGLGLLVQLASYLLKLGVLWPAPWVVGGLALFPLVRSATQGRDASMAFVLLIPALLAYATIIFVTESRWVDRKSHRTFRMTWEDRGSGNEYGEPEIVLRYVDHPRHVVGIYSRELARHLHDRDRDTIDVVFRVTRDLGCLRGLSAREVEGLHRWQTTGGYSGHTEPGAVAPPVGEDPFWCP